MYFNFCKIWLVKGRGWSKQAPSTEFVHWVTLTCHCGRWEWEWRDKSRFHWSGWNYHSGRGKHRNRIFCYQLKQNQKTPILYFLDEKTMWFSFFFCLRKCDCYGHRGYRTAVHKTGHKQPCLFLWPRSLHLKHFPPEFFMHIRIQLLAVDLTWKRIKCI